MGKQICLIKCINLANNEYAWLNPKDNEIQYGTLELAKENLANIEVALIISTEDVLLTKVDVGNLKTKKLALAVPYLLEEGLAEDVEQHFFAIISVKKNIAYVAVIKRNLFSGLINKLYAHNIKLTKCIPEVLLLPNTKDCWSLYLTDEKILIKTGEFSGFAIENKSGEILLQSLLEEYATPREINCYLVNPNLEISCYKQIADKKDIPFNCQKEKFILFEHAKEQVSDEKINLLQGEYKPKINFRFRRNYFTAACVAMLTVILTFTGNLYHYYSLKSKNVELDKKILKLYQQVFPNSKVAYSPKIMLERELAKYASSGNNNLFIILQGLGKAKNNMPETVFEAISYQKDKLNLAAMFLNFSEAEQFIKILQENNLLVKRDSSSQQQNHIVAQLTVSIKDGEK